MPLQVEKIQDGTVIDHIDAFRGLKVLEILGLVPDAKSLAPAHSTAAKAVASTSNSRIALLINVPSRKMGRKDILKVEGRHLSASEVNKIALIAPHACLNDIKEGKVGHKQVVQLPHELEGIATCPNVQCVSVSEKLGGRFTTEPKGLRCRYCERLFRSNELVL